MNPIFIRQTGPLNWARRTFVRQLYKRVLKREQVITLPSGRPMTLPLGSSFASEIYITGCNVDWGAERLFYDMLTGKGAFLDIGANIGYFALYMAPRATRTFAFEPDPRSIARLESNLTGQGDIELVPMAVGREAGTAQFTLAGAPELSSLSAAGSSGSSGNADTVSVPVVTIDGFVKERGLQVEAIKTDIEGFDLDALLAATETLKGQRPLVLTEAPMNAEIAALAEGVDYAIWCYALNRETGTKRFIEGKNLKSAESAKMLFMVPSERVGELRSKA
ncbi:FkbM family methyltransferase [Aurantiacibacter marinus]|uniref:FkbM family methyltransferase n=1 Tax=Aurantiacibacter marinus TaxID=874156 RepID=UPI00063D5194|nr:FkbM family methyltransferase [Aurantiacibacter marinus]